ncbi:hypothetical protein [Microcoleus sp. herbarium12]|uniref:hypothetical protein n=1 Tax=Microcoleus sp. herbarium12 TaxID=3055437 RepID=UPI002FD7105F
MSQTHGRSPETSPNRIAATSSRPRQPISQMDFQKHITISSKFCAIAPKEVKPSPPTKIPDLNPSQDVPTQPAL